MQGGVGEPDHATVRRYYEATLGALLYLEHRAPAGRRFGPDADLLYRAFEGHLQPIDRVDLLLRDADAQWPGSLGARRVFRRAGVPDDDAFGKGWSPLDSVAGAALLREVTAAPPPGGPRRRAGDAFYLEDAGAPGHRVRRSQRHPGGEPADALRELRAAALRADGSHDAELTP